ncbi:MAG: hypothetical protein R2941_25035 [Desulfobacterales bacterium]
MKKNGVSIGDMQAKMLAKIRRTDHMIEQNKKLEQLANENLILKRRLPICKPQTRP